MRTIIAGGRNINDATIVALAVTKADFKITHIISGGASGIDALAAQYAVRNGVPFTNVPARWDEYGRSAGPRRNGVMAELADCLIAIWDGQSAGTKNMIETFKQKNPPNSKIITVKDYQVHYYWS